MSNLLFSVFTPAYNSIDTIHRVWESLQAQTLRDFEWIIIDDGSIDNLDVEVSKFIIQSEFKIVFIRQENRGKHVAWNRSLDVASGTLFVPADADDRFESDTLEFFSCVWSRIDESDKQQISGINVLCKDSKSGQIVGDLYPNDGFLSTQLELFYKYRIKGEKWGCIRTDILRKYKFPEISGRGSYILSYAWFGMSHHYSVICFNRPLRIYYRDNASSISNSSSKNIRKSALTDFHYLAWHLSTNYRFLFLYRRYFELLKISANIWRIGYFLKYGFKKIYQSVSGKIVLLHLLLFPIGYILYFVTYRKVSDEY